MPLSLFCRVSALFLFSFTYFTHLSANTTNPSIVITTNRITSTKDSVSTCTVALNGEHQDCQEFKTSISLRNPIAVATNATNLFIANYGAVKISGTSFVLMCDMPTLHTTEISCKSLFGLASTAHVPGIAAFGQKFLFVESFNYKNNVNFNYVVACNINAEGRKSECSIPLRLMPLTQTQSSFNTSMPITITNNFAYISDNAGESVYECTFPDEQNHMECKALTFAEALPLLPNGFVNQTSVFIN